MKMDDRFDSYVTLAIRVFKVADASINFLDTNRQWFKSRVGLPSCFQTSRNEAFCTYSIMDDSPPVMVVPNALEDDRFASNPLVTGAPYIRFYAGAPILVDGMKIGTICIVDQKPREGGLTEKEQGILLEIAQCIADLIIERRNQAMELEVEVNQLYANILHLAKRPIHEVMQSYQGIQSTWQQLILKGDKVGGLLQKQVVSLEQEVQELMCFVDKILNMMVRIMYIQEIQKQYYFPELDIDLIIANNDSRDDLSMCMSHGGSSYASTARKGLVNTRQKQQIRQSVIETIPIQNMLYCDVHSLETQLQHLIASYCPTPASTATTTTAAAASVVYGPPSSPIPTNSTTGTTNTCRHTTNTININTNTININTNTINTNTNHSRQLSKELSIHSLVRVFSKMSSLSSLFHSTTSIAEEESIRQPQPHTVIDSIVVKETIPVSSPKRMTSLPPQVFSFRRYNNNSSSMLSPPRHTGITSPGTGITSTGTGITPTGTTSTTTPYLFTHPDLIVLSLETILATLSNHQHTGNQHQHHTGSNTTNNTSNHTGNHTTNNTGNHTTNNTGNHTGNHTGNTLPVSGNGNGGGILSCDVVLDTCYHQAIPVSGTTDHTMQVFHIEGVLEHFSCPTSGQISGQVEDAFLAIQDICARIGGYFRIHTTTSSTTSNTTSVVSKTTFHMFLPCHSLTTTTSSSSSPPSSPVKRMLRVSSGGKNSGNSGEFSKDFSKDFSKEFLHSSVLQSIPTKATPLPSKLLRSLHTLFYATRQFSTTNTTRSSRRHGCRRRRNSVICPENDQPHISQDMDTNMKKEELEEEKEGNTFVSVYE